MIKILTVVHWADLFQLKLQAESLSKLWNGNKRWTIVIEDPLPSIQAASLEWCKEHIHIDNWVIDFVIPDNPEIIKHNGWLRQQMCKMIYAAMAEEEWVLILDAKNFLIKPTDESFFLRDNSIVYLPRLDNDDFFKSSNTAAKKMLGSTAEIPSAASMTPWIFNKQEILNLVNLLGISIDYWPDNTATEFTLYWNWAYHKFDWEPLQFVTGFWQTEYTNSMYGDTPSILAIKEGTLSDELRFWTHHRYVTNAKARTVTMTVLKDAGLSSEIIDQWNIEFKKFLSKTFARRHQEFLKNRQGIYPGFNKQWYK
jgi:hypothetical protein